MKITGLYDEKTILSELGNRIQQPKTSVMPRMGVFRARVAKADNQLNRHNAALMQ